MNQQNKKIIFLEDSLDGGEETPEISHVSNTSSEQFGEVTEDAGGLEQIDVNAQVSSLDGGENIELNMTNHVSDDASIASEKSELSDLISEGGRSSISSGSSVSTVNTSDLLSVDPMYIRLTKFLETDIKLEGGSNKRVNVTELLSDISGSLKDINVTFKEMSGVLQKMALTNATQ